MNFAIKSGEYKFRNKGDEISTISLSTPALAVSTLGVDSTNLRAVSQVSISDAADRQYNKECMQASRTKLLLDLDLAKESTKKTLPLMQKPPEKQRKSISVIMVQGGITDTYSGTASERYCMHISNAVFICCILS